MKPYTLIIKWPSGRFQTFDFNTYNDAILFQREAADAIRDEDSLATLS